MYDFQGYFPGLSKTLSFNFQYVPGSKFTCPGLSRSWNFQEKIQDFPGGVGTWNTRPQLGLNCEVMLWLNPQNQRSQDGDIPRPDVHVPSRCWHAVTEAAELDLILADPDNTHHDTPVTG